MRKVLFLVMLLACVCANGQSVQKGIVYEYHGREDKTPLAGVVINAGGATAKSNTYGNFKLSFNNLKVGDRVAADPDNCAMLKNYIVFNIDAVQQWNVSSSGNMFTIVLCRKDKFDKMVMTYYNASDKSLKQQLKREQERARQALKEQQIQKAEYEQLLEEANQRYQQATESMQQNAELVARIDESELEGNQAKILELASQGKLDEAVELIMQDSTTVLLERAAKKRDYVAEQEQYYKDKREEANSEVAKLVARLKDNIKVLQLAGGKENYDLCVEYWEKIVAADTTDLKNINEAANFFYYQARYDLAEECLTMSLNKLRSLAETNPDANDYMERNLLFLGVMYTDTHQYDKSEQCLLQALDVLDNLEISDSVEYKIRCSGILNNLGTLCYEQNQFDKAEQYYARALDIRKSVVVDSMRLGDYSQSLFDMGKICHASKMYDKAEEYYLQVVDIQKGLASSATYSSLAMPVYGLTLDSVSRLYFCMKQYDKALEYGLQSLQVRKALAENNPDVRALPYAGIMIDLARIYVEINDYETARSYFAQAMKIFEERGAKAEELPADVEKMRGVLR